MDPTQTDASITAVAPPPPEIDVADAVGQDDADGVPSAGVTAESVITWVLVALCCGFVLYSLHPDLVFANTTPTGGDMGAHVWGPRFLREELIPSLRLAGWTQDWYAGFPAYLFYMVVPSLMIVWLATSPPLWLVPFLFVGLAAAVVVGIPRIRTPWTRHLAIGAAVMAAILFLPVPYPIAFKLVTVSGLVTLPVAAAVLARSLSAPFPVPALVAMSTLPFIYDSGFTILGGNGASTMAGEFAFSISLTFALFYLATLFAGARTGRWRAPGALFLALTVLCHIIPAIFAVVVTVVVVPFLRRDPRGVHEDRPDDRVGPRPQEPEPRQTGEPAHRPAVEPEPQPADEPVGPVGVTNDAARPWWATGRVGPVVAVVVMAMLVGLVLVDRSWLNATAEHDPSVGGLAHWQFLLPALGTIAAIVFFTGFSPRFTRRVSGRVGSLVAVAITIGLGLALVVRPSNWGVAIALTIIGFLYFVEIDRAAIRWVLAVAPVAALVTAFWILPFLAASTYMNDMGWEKYTRYWDYLLAVPELDSGGMPLRAIVFVAAGLGIVLSMIMRIRLGWFLGLVVVLFAWLFRYFPQYRLWNARLLPFYFLAIYMLAGLGAALTIRFAAELLTEGHPDDLRGRAIRWVGSCVVVLVVLAGLLGSFKALPGGRVVPDPRGSDNSVYEWGSFRLPFRLPFMSTRFGFDGFHLPLGIVPDWAAWNFSGVERKTAYPEFRGVVDMMDNIGRNEGCGRAFWEFDPDLNRFGTTMALMMLPYYTDGCIASMEGLYFEASTTTPFHFLMQSALSSSPSRAQREMPYPDFDIELGVRQMQMMGVRYYMASSDRAIAAAEAEPRLEKLAEESFEGVDGERNRWAVFAVSGVRLVQGLANDPVVLTDANDHIDGWVYAEERLDPTPAQLEAGNPGSKTSGPAVDWFMSPARWDVFLATSGPPEWPRADAEDAMAHTEPLPAVSVTDVEIRDGRISFDVDRTGVPVLVRESYFPNWRASGAEGPYRVTPNFMVVVPTDRHVVLTYGRSWADIAGVGLTLSGIAGIVALAVLDDRRRAGTSQAVSTTTGSDGDELPIG